MQLPTTAYDMEEEERTTVCTCMQLPPVQVCLIREGLSKLVDEAAPSNDDKKTHDFELSARQAGYHE